MTTYDWNGKIGFPGRFSLSDHRLENGFHMNSAAASPSRASAPAPAGETVLWQGTPSRWNYLASWFWGALLLPFGVGLLILLGAYVRRRRLHYLVTTDKLVARYGLFVVSSRELRICDVRSINIYRRGLPGLLGLGTIEFSSAAHDAASAFFHGILAAEAVADLVRALQVGVRPAPLPGSGETESNAAAALHFAGLALVPIFCAFFVALGVRDTIQKSLPRLGSPVAAIRAAPAAYPDEATTLLPTPDGSRPAAPRAVADPPASEGGASAVPSNLPLPTRKPVSAPRAFARAVAASRSRAVKRYPALATAGSHFNTAFVTRYEQLAREHSARLQDPNWPEQLAAECAAKIPPAYQ